jgi:hypothetical protein
MSRTTAWRVYFVVFTIQNQNAYLGTSLPGAGRRPRGVRSYGITGKIF